LLIFGSDNFQISVVEVKWRAPSKPKFYLKSHLLSEFDSLILGGEAAAFHEINFTVGKVEVKSVCDILTVSIAIVNHCVKVVIGVVEPYPSKVLILNVEVKWNDEEEAADEGYDPDKLHPQNLTRV